MYVEPDAMDVDSSKAQNENKPDKPDINKNIEEEEVLEETKISDKKFGSNLNVFDNLDEKDLDQSNVPEVEEKLHPPKETNPIRESIIGELLVKDEPLNDIFLPEDEDSELSDQEFEELENPSQIEQDGVPSDIEEIDEIKEDDMVLPQIVVITTKDDNEDGNDSEIEELSVASSAAEAQETPDEEAGFVNDDSEGASENDEEENSDFDEDMGGDDFEEFTEHEIEASVNLSREHHANSDSGNSKSDYGNSDEEQDILVIEKVTPEGILERSFSTNARSIRFSVDEADDNDNSSITQSYRQHHDWESLLNRSYERNERLLSTSHMSHASHMSHVSEVSKMSEKELLESIDIDTVLVETTEYTTEEIDPATSNVTVVTHTTFTEVCYFILVFNFQNFSVRKYIF